MFINFTRATVIALAMTMPVAMQAQRGGGMGAGRGGRMGSAGPGGNPVAPLIDMRRELNLSSRQLTQLDSIERTLIQRNQTIRDRMRTRLDSLRPRTREGGEAEIQRYRAESDSLRALRQVIMRNDSTARASAMNVLTDSQRVRVRERMAERRGFEAGRMSTMRGGERGMRGMRGRQGQQGFGPRMRQGPGMGRGGMQGQGFGPRAGGMRGPDGLGPRRFENRMMPDDSTPMRFRRPPGGAEGQGVGPRRQFDDSTRVQRAPRRPPADSGR